jgi:iron complex outermembrane receptor protein
MASTVRQFTVLLFIFAISLSLRPRIGIGQAPDSLIVELPEVTVEAARATETEATAPFTVSTRQRSLAEQTLEAPVFLRDILSDIPGVWLNDRGHFALGERLVVRGMGWRSPFGVRGVQALLDGIPLTLPDGQAFLDIVPPLFVRRAETIRGPSSLFWGNGSGGVLFLDSTPETDAPPAQLRVGGGSFGLQQVAGEVIVGDPDSTGRWRIAFSDMRRDGYRDNSDGRFTRGLLSGELTLSSNTQMKIVGAFVDQDARNPGSLTREEMEENPTQTNGLFDAFDAGKQSTQSQLGLTVTHDFGSLSLDATAYGGVRDLENPLPFAVIAFDRTYAGGRTALRGTTGPVEWNAGVDMGYQRDDRVNYATDISNVAYTDSLTLDQLETVVSTSAFGYGRLPLTDRLRFTVGGRLDLIDFTLDDEYRRDGVDDSGNRTFSAFSPGIGLAYETGPALFFVNYNTAFETPTTTELVNRPGRTGGFNSSLDPQRTQGVEVGARGFLQSAQLEYDLALYYLSVDDRLVAFDFPNSDRTYFRNLGENTHQGIEIALRWQASSWLELRTTYTGNRSVFEGADVDEQESGTPEIGDLSGNRVPGVPEHRFFGQATGTFSPLWLRLSVDTVSDYYADNANTAVSEGYALVDLRAGLQDLSVGTVQLRPYAEVSNLFDTQYNGSVSINAGGNFFEPGAGRAFKAGITATL